MKKQRGVSLIITFLIMTVMLAIVLSVSVILTSEVKILSNMGSSVSALYASETGIEKTLYFDRKQWQGQQNRGFCNICQICGPQECTSCTATPLNPEGDGCNPLNCINCRVQYTSTFEGRTYSIDATVVPNPPNPPVFTVNARGFYNNTTRLVQSLITD